MALKLSLKPGEKFVVNGAVIQNGDRRSIVLLQNRASILREKDILQQEEANSPARRVYFPVMLMYLEPDGSAGTGRHYEEFVLRMNEFMSAVQNTEIIAECVSLSCDVMGGNFYRALGRCRKLMRYEQERLEHVHSELPENNKRDRQPACNRI